jgi:hypothetical protein
VSVQHKHEKCLLILLCYDPFPYSTLTFTIQEQVFFTIKFKAGRWNYTRDYNIRTGSRSSRMRRDRKNTKEMDKSRGGKKYKRVGWNACTHHYKRQSTIKGHYSSFYRISFNAT